MRRLVVFSFLAGTFFSGAALAARTADHLGLAMACYKQDDLQSLTKTISDYEHQEAFEFFKNNKCLVIGPRTPVEILDSDWNASKIRFKIEEYSVEVWVENRMIVD